MHDGHRLRVKERFLSEGLDTFERHNILEFLLYYCNPRGDTNEIAHELLNRFGSFSAVLDAPYDELIKVKGIGQHAASLLKFIPHVSRIYMEDLELPSLTLNTSEEIGEYLLVKYIGRTLETLFVMLLDNKGNLLCCQKVFEGSITSLEINMRKIIELCLRYRATVAIVAHNHPRGSNLPSREDITSTVSLKNALKLVDVKLVDHFIIANGKYTSLAETPGISDIFY